MKIKGLQKITLIDYPEKIASTIFLFGCNFNCGFCHNPELVLKENKTNISEKETIDFLIKRKKQLEGVCITGGEPLLSLNLNFLKKIKKLGYLIKIDTNGSFPEKIKEVTHLVDYIAMDIKSSKENYQKVTNSKVDLENIEKSIKLISNLEYYEFRTTIIQDIHTQEEMIKIAKWLNSITRKKPKKYCLQPFKNQGKFIDIKFKTKKDTSKEYLNKLKETIKPYFENIEIIA